jgi:Bacterial Ig domain/Periplasmic copper-binding protein (NosD)/Protein of unknown function (DUF1565)
MDRLLHPLSLALLLVFLTSTAWAATYHVSLSGADTNAGTASAPWRTVGKATQTAQPGDTVQIGAGTFAERLTFTNSGTAAAPITYIGSKSGSEWQTIIDGTTPVTTNWTAQGNGVYTTSLGYDPQVLSAANLFVWRCGDHAMTSGACQTRLNQSANATCNMSIGNGPCWDGVEALFGHLNGQTYLKFRNGDNPSTKQVRAGRFGGAVTIDNRHYITLKDLKIVGGGDRTVDLKGGAQGTRIDGCYVAGSAWRIHLEGNVQDTTITRSLITYDGIGMATHTPGDWSSVTPARIVNRWQYDTGKFLVGNTQTKDSDILLVSATNTTITHNILRNSLAGITFYNSTADTTIAYNQIYQHSDNGVYLDSDNSSGSFHHNLIYDNDHGMRWNSTHRTMVWNVYANRFFGNTEDGKNIFIAGPREQPGGSNIQFYHNSCAGGGWCLDVGSDGAQVNLSFVHARNLMHSARGLSSWGGVQWGTMDHVYNDSTTWKGKPMGDFVLPPGHPALDSAPLLTLPGMDAAYYVDGRADHGAIQAGVVDGGGTPEPPDPPPSGDTQPPLVTITAPAEGATIAGLVTVTATVSDNVKVTGVEFFVDGSPRGEPQCCTSIQVVGDSTRVTDGPHVLTATARDAANNVGTSQPINIVVSNGSFIPDPPDPPTPGTGSLSCTGELGAKGAIVLTCVPTPTRR